MFCYHCGYELNEKKLEEKKSSRQGLGEDVNVAGAEVEYICPRCGHLIRHGGEEEDHKALSRACHAELQRGRNHTARGMSFLSIALILLVTAIIFFTLSNKLKESGGGREISFSSPEFWVFVILTAISVILLVFGTIHVIQGFKKKHVYTNLLKDINNGTFVQ